MDWARLAQSHERGDGLPPAAAGAPGLARASFRDIYEQQFDYVHRAVRRLGIPVSDLEDAVHDVFVVVHRRLDHYDPRRPVRPWLFGIAFRVASDRRRRPVEIAGREADMLAVADGRPSPEAHLATEEARRRVHAALDTLPLDQRAVLAMHDLEGHSAPEVAEGLGVGLNTVYSRLRLAREKFVIALRAGGPG
jgi:RNA polymerase sigma-70 factor (ECF subfamily)